MTRWQVLRFGVMTAVLASGYGVMFTVLDDFRDEYGIAEYWLGLIVGIGFMAGFVAQVFLAPIADRGHARRMVFLGLGLNVIGLLTMAVGEAVPVLLAGRLVSGLGMGMAIPAIRRIVINADPDHIGTNVGLLISADVTGFAFGPVVSAILVPSLGLPAPFIAIAAATAVCTGFVLRLPIVEAKPEDAPKERLALDLLRHRPLVAGLMLGAGVFLMIGTFDAMWAIVLDDLDASEFIANIGITIFALPLIFLATTGGKLAQRFGPFRVGPLGLLIGAGFMFGYGFWPSAALMLTFGTVHAISDGLTIASAGVAVGMAAPPARQASAQGLLGATEALTGGVTAAIAGVLYSVGGRVLAYTTSTVVMIALAVGAYLLVGDEYRRRRGPDVEKDVDVTEVVSDPASAVTGHA